MRIGLFDSGVGGLNVLKEFLKKYPHNEYYYYGDTKNVPYGDKDKETLLNLSSNIIKFFEQKQVDLIIIACGTISSNCFEELKQITSIPLISVIEPTIAYVKGLKKEKIAVFGTRRTIDSHIFRNKLEQDILEIAPIEFVPMIEKNEIDTLVVKKYVDLLDDYDVLILGCTHYPLLMKEITKYLKKDIVIIDMGVCLVNQINLMNETKQIINLYFTKVDENLINNIDNILECEYSLIKL